MHTDTTLLKKKLLEEKALLEKELATIARKNPDHAGDWEAVPEDRGVAPASRDDVADKLESFEENIAITRQLEARFAEVKGALLRLENGAFGICIICHKDVEPERLLANPAALTCKEHLNQK